jgi:hypothetical protein
VSGVSVVNSLASAAAAVTALVPAAQIASGAIVLQGPDASVLPAVSISSVDSMERPTSR